MNRLPIIVAWGFVAVGMCGVLATALTGLGGFYNPNQDGAHLSAFYAMFWMGVICAALFLAFLILSKRDLWSVSQQWAVLAACVLTALAIERGYVASHPQASHYLYTVKDVHDAVPRAYANRVMSDRSADLPIGAQVCLADMTPRKSGECLRIEGTADHAIVALSEGPMQANFRVSDTLTRLDVPFENDTLGPVPEGVGRIEDGMLVLADGTASLMLRLNAVRRIEQAVWCRKSFGACSVYVRTEFGNLSYTSAGGHTVDVARWEAHKHQAEALLAQWRCADRSCDGLFEKGAREAYE